MRFKRSSLVTKLLLLALVIYAAVTLVSLQEQVEQSREQEKVLEDSIASTQQENQRWNDKINALGTDIGVEQVARDKLGWVSDGEIVFYDVGN